MPDPERPDLSELPNLADAQRSIWRRPWAAIGCLLLVTGLVFGGLILLNQRPLPTRPDVGLASPSVPPTPSPTVAPTLTPSPQPTQPPTPSPTPTVAPTATPAPQPTPSPGNVPPDGTYYGSGTFTSYDGETSFATHWRVIKAGATGEITQLVSSGGAPYQIQQGIVDPRGLLVAVSPDDVEYCEALILLGEFETWFDEMFVAYGPPSMFCPEPEDLADLFWSLDSELGELPDRATLEAAFREEFGGWDEATIGSVPGLSWTFSTE